MSTFRKRVFSTAPVIFFSLGLKLLRFFCFWECPFGRDQISQFNNDTFSKMFSAMKVLVMCLPYVKRCFQSHQWHFLLFSTQITQIVLFWRTPGWERSTATVWEQYNFQKFFEYWFFWQVFNFCEKVLGKVSMPPISGCFLKYPEYPGYLFPPTSNTEINVVKFSRVATTPPCLLGLSLRYYKNVFKDILKAFNDFKNKHQKCLK